MLLILSFEVNNVFLKMIDGLSKSHECMFMGRLYKEKLFSLVTIFYFTSHILWKISLYFMKTFLQYIKKNYKYKYKVYDMNSYWFVIKNFIKILFELSRAKMS